MEYEFNEVAEDLAEDIIEKSHARLKGLKIAYLFKVRPVTYDAKGNFKPRKPKFLRAGKKEVWAKAAKVTDKYMPLLKAQFRFVIEFDREVWDRITDAQRKALVDHELCHCGVDAEGCYMKMHDLEEFKEVVERHGYWKSDIERFMDAEPPLFRQAPAKVKDDQTTITLSTPGMKPVTLSDEEFKRLTKRLSGRHPRRTTHPS